MDDIFTMNTDMHKNRVLHLLVQPLITVVFLIVGSLLTSRIFGPSINITNLGSQQRTFTVEGSGTVTTKPDSFQTDFTVTATGSTQEAAKKNGNEIQNKAITTLKKAGFTDKNITTANFTIYPDYRGVVPPNIQPTPTGYTYNMTTTLHADKVEKLNQAIDMLTPLGVSVSSVRSLVGDTSAYKDQAREIAVKDAKRKAESMAKAGEFKLGKIASIKEADTASSTPPGYPVPLLERSTATPDTRTQINPGTQDITSTISITFYLND